MADNNDDVPVTVKIEKKRKVEGDSADLPSPKKEKGVAPPAPPSSSGAKGGKFEYPDDPDWDDDKPISDNMEGYLKNRAARQQQAQETKRKDEAQKKEKRASSSGGGTRTPASTRLDQQYYTNTEKGKMVQKLLSRWWYAFSWPNMETIDKAPDGYEMLSGFSGVYVSMRTSNLGHILDLRDMDDMCPSLRCMSRKSAAELQELCITAYEKQIAALKEAEGDDTKFEMTLKKELHVVKRVDVTMAEKEAKNFNFEE